LCLNCIAIQPANDFAGDSETHGWNSFQRKEPSVFLHARDCAVCSCAIATANCPAAKPPSPGGIMPGKPTGWMRPANL
jgi:hypothetical protein